MPPLTSFVCNCGYPLCLCEFSTPVKTPATAWLPPTPADSSRKPSVSMWIPAAETTPSPPLVSRSPSPGRTPTSGCWLSKPTVAMPGWTATTTSPAVTRSSPSPTSASNVKATPGREGVRDRLSSMTGIAVKCSDPTLQISKLERAVSNTVDVLSRQHKINMEALNNKHEEEMNALQGKYNAVYFLCKNLAIELARKDKMISLLREGDAVQQTLCQQQEELTRSTLALVKQHKTKFSTHRHQLVYSSTDTSPEVQQEMSVAAARLRAEKAKEERASITKLSSTVDRLAKKYDRYNIITETNLLNTRCDADGLPCIVPRVFMGIWLLANQEEPTQEEITMYEFHLQKQVRGPPIYSPNLPRPTVNWTNLNKHRRKNLPDPEMFPIHSVPQDPSYYSDLAMYKPADMHNSLWPPKDCACVSCVSHFGYRYGLMTDMGVISMPDSAVHGYRWDDYTAGWVIATGC